MTPSEQYTERFYQGSRQASRDVDEFGLQRAQETASKMRRDSFTPYADGYCIRVGELSRNPQGVKA